MVLLSGIGAYYAGVLIRNSFFKRKKLIAFVVLAVLFILLIFYIFQDHNEIPYGVTFIQPLDMADIEALVVLKDVDFSIVMAPLVKSTAIYPLVGHMPVATRYFHGRQQDKDAVRRFYNSSCDEKQGIVEFYNVSYVFSDRGLRCNWTLLYSNNRFIYNTNFINSRS